MLLYALLFVALLVLYRRIQRDDKKKRLGCVDAPTVGLVDMLRIFLGGKKMETWRLAGPLFEKYGPTFQLYSGWRTWVFTCEPENFKAILSSQGTEFDLGRRPTQFALMFGPKGVFTAQGQDWQHCRTLLKPQFSRQNVSHLNMLETHIPVLFQIIKNKNGFMDIQEILFRYTITIALDFLVGTNIQSLEAYLDNPDLTVFGEEVDWNIEYPLDSPEGRNRFIQAFEHGLRDVYRRAVYYDTYWMLRTPNSQQARNEINRHINHFINEALNADEEKLKEVKNYVFLYRLIEENRDPGFLRDQLMSLLIAARDTTTSLLTWTMFYLARNPNVVERLKSEIRTTFGSGTEDDVSSITFDSLKTCQYLRHVLNETLRCASAVPMNYRGASTDTSLPNGADKAPTLIERGHTVYFSTYYLHRRKDIWGEDAEEWNPERWETMKHKPWAFVPFGGGPRVCVGQQYSLAEASYLLVRLFQEFETIDCMPGEESQSHDPIQFKQMATLFMEGGCNVKIQ